MQDAAILELVKTLAAPAAPAPAAPAEDPVLQTFIRAKAKADAKSAICAAGSARLAAIAAASGAGEAGQQALAEMEAELAALN